jgi:hypothetical protein
MRIVMNKGLLLAAIVVGALLALPATAQPDPGRLAAPTAEHLLLKAPAHDHGEVCCRYSLGSHARCHAPAALPAVDCPVAPIWTPAPIVARAVPLHAVPIPPPLKPPNASL